MTKLYFTKQEIADIKSKIYLTDEEEQVLELWLKESSIVETSIKLCLSERTISRRRKSIIRKIGRVI